MRKYQLQKNKGFTLTEAIISLTIFALVVVIVYSSYALSRQSYLEGENVAEITQNGRVVLERISREIRQAKEIVTELPQDRMSAKDEIKFHDGHLSLVFEEDTAQGGTAGTITLAPGASSQDGYYKDMFIKIIGGTGDGQIRKIYDYDGTTKIANIGNDWTTIPDMASTYKIDTSFYYIHYYKDNNDIKRKVITHCFKDAGFPDCKQPETYVSWNATPPSGQDLLEVELKAAQVIGEYVNSLEFWDSGDINIYLVLENKGKSIDFRTKVFGRNL